MSLNPEATVPCPYNKAHTIVLSRMQFHLQKCRAQHPQAEKVTCPFNTTHIVNKVELEWHLEWCTSRITGEREFFRIGSMPEKNDLLPIDDKVPDFTGNEVWGEEEACGESVLEKVREVSQIKPALTNKICATKSVRKQHKLDERRRFINVLESGKNNDDTSAVQSPTQETHSFSQEVPSSTQEVHSPTQEVYNPPQESRRPAQLVSTAVHQDKEAVGGTGATRRNQPDSGAGPWKGWKNISSPGIEVGMSEIRLNDSSPQTTMAPRNPSNPWGNRAAQQQTSSSNEFPSLDFPGLPSSGRGKRLQQPK